MLYMIDSEALLCFDKPDAIELMYYYPDLTRSNQDSDLIHINLLPLGDSTFAT